MKGNKEGIKNMSSKEIFLINVVIDTIIKVSFCTRNKDAHIYGNNVSDKDRIKLKTSIKNYLIKLLDEISEEKKDRIEDDILFEKINNLSDIITEKYYTILENNRFRIGISQKLINLLLKYYWAMGKIGTPPHCPYDGIIKKYISLRLTNCNLIDWTILDNIEDYKDIMNAIDTVSSKDSYNNIAEWELNIFNNLNYVK